MPHYKRSKMKEIKSIITDAISLVLKSLSYPLKNYSLTSPQKKEHGDISSNIALLLANDLKKKPMDIGKSIADKLNILALDNISSITIAEPGFLNFHISNRFFQSKIQKIINENVAYGKGDIGINKTANVEFVSANPTGPLTVGHGRNAILGDTVSNILEWQGFKVTREYYFNDAGRQMRVLGKSVEARYFELLKKDIKFPEDGYHGDYIIDIAQIIRSVKNDNIRPDDPFFSKKAEEIIFTKIKKTLLNLGIHFDQFTNEKTFYENGEIEQFINELKEKDLIYKKDNATWFKSTSLGKDQDRVYIKSSGEPTYRVPDTAYHKNKINRNYDIIIDVFGADHADTYPDVLIALKALGLNTDHIRILLYQFVTLIKGGNKIKMSTRKANYVTLDDLIKELGQDVVRYFFVMRSMNTHLDFDLDLAADQSDKNPVYYIQYAHARICNIIKQSQNLDYNTNTPFDPYLITDINEISLLKHLVMFPEIIDRAYKNLEPQYIANFLQELAAKFHRFYNNCRVITDDKNLSKARIKLIISVKIVLKNGLSILGITAPEKM